MPGSLTAEQTDYYHRQGYLVVEHLLGDADLRPARKAMCRKVDAIAAELLERGLVDDLRRDSPFETRLAELFDGNDRRASSWSTGEAGGTAIPATSS